MSFLDVLALIIIGVSVLTAVVKGLLKELVALGSVLIGLFLAILFYSEAAFVFEFFDIGEMFADFLAFILIFVATIVLGVALGSVLDRVLKLLHLKWLDRLLGAVFGLLRGYLICLVVFLAFTAFPINRDALSNSRLRDYFLFGADLLVNFAPAEFREQFLEGWQKLYQELLEPKDTDRL